MSNIQEPKVPSYSPAAWKGAWAGRARGLWGGSAIGLFFGAAVGLLAPFFPVLFGSLALGTALEMLGASTLIFAASGMAAGFAACGLAGATAGSVSEVAKEQERRSNLQMQALGLSVLQEEKIKKPDRRSFREKFLDTKDSYFNIRTGIAFIAFGVIGGAVLGAAFIAGGPIAMPATTMLLASADLAVAPGTTAAFSSLSSIVMPYFMGVMGMFGGLWAFNFSKITAGAQNFFGRLMSGELLGTNWEPKRAGAREQEVSVVVSSPPEADVSHAVSYREMVLRHPSDHGLHR